MSSFDERRQCRQALRTSGKFRRGVGIALPVGITDLTEHGCRLDSIPRNLRRGDYISLRVAGFGPIEGELKWLHLGKSAGVQFYTPLHQAVFEHIIAKHRAEEARQARPSAHLVSLRKQIEAISDCLFESTSGNEQ